MRRLLSFPIALMLLAAVYGCAGTASGNQTPAAGAQHAATASTGATAPIPDAMAVPMGAGANAKDPLDKGWFTFSSVVDGDTYWVLEASESLRLLCIDSEETIKTDEDRTASQVASLDWAKTVADARASQFLTTRLVPKAGVSRTDLANRWKQYSSEMRHNADRPQKYGTPYGDLAKDYAKWFFEQADSWDGNKDSKIKIRLEIDDPKRQIDVYGRYLVYSFVQGPDGKEVNFHVEQVRVGMSPYFPKYGHSVRYRKEFEQAQQEAQAAKRGIWSDDWGHYPDYDERIAWWGERGDTLNHFASTYGQNPDYFDLSSPTELVRLRDKVGKEAVVYGLISGIRGRSDPATITLATGDDSIQFPIGTSNTIAIAVEDKKWAEHYVYARGTVTDQNGSLHMDVTQDADVWVEPAYLAELYATGKSRDFGEKEMAKDLVAAGKAVGHTATPPPPSTGPILTDKATGLKIIPWDRAEEFENQGEVLVEGTVVAAKVAGKVAFINFHNDFKHTFSIFIPPTSLSAFSNAFESFPDGLVGKTVRVRGTIIHFDKNGQQKPEIVAEDPKQLTIVS